MVTPKNLCQAELRAFRVHGSGSLGFDKDIYVYISIWDAI